MLAYEDDSVIDNDEQKLKTDENRDENSDRYSCLSRFNYLVESFRSLRLLPFTNLRNRIQ